MLYSSIHIHAHTHAHIHASGTAPVTVVVFSLSGRTLLVAAGKTVYSFAFHSPSQDEGEGQEERGSPPLLNPRYRMQCKLEVASVCTSENGAVLLVCDADYNTYAWRMDSGEGG
jgi:hypothetical protein